MSKNKHQKCNQDQDHANDKSGLVQDRGIGHGILIFPSFSSRRSYQMKCNYLWKNGLWQYDSSRKYSYQQASRGWILPLLKECLIPLLTELFTPTRELHPDTAGLSSYWNEDSCNQTDDQKNTTNDEYSGCVRSSDKILTHCHQYENQSTPTECTCPASVSEHCNLQCFMTISQSKLYHNIYAKAQLQKHPAGGFSPCWRSVCKTS